MSQRTLLELYDEKNDKKTIKEPIFFCVDFDILLTSQRKQTKSTAIQRTQFS